MATVRIDCRNRSTFVSVFTYLTEPNCIVAYPQERTFIISEGNVKIMADYLKSIGLDMNNVDIYEL